MDFDVIVIGAGQAGLSMGYYLKQSNTSFLLLDKGNEIGEVWRKRYDSLTLFTPRSLCSLPGLLLGGSENIYPTKDEIADYLSNYAKTYSLPLLQNTNVERLIKTNNGFRLITNNGELNAKNVVVATGPFQKAFVPKFSNSLTDSVLQLHSSDYKNPMQLKSGSVLVVGGGNSGAQIAVELSKERDVFLSISQKMKFLPQDIGSKSIFWWFKKLGILNANTNSKVGQLIQNQNDPIFGLELKRLIKEEKVSLKPRTSLINNDAFLFQDGSEVKVNNVIWSTGFISDYSWIDISDVLNEKGLPIHERGITSKDGLYFLGLPWQYRRGSALLQGVGVDAWYLYNRLVNNKL